MSLDCSTIWPGQDIDLSIGQKMTQEQREQYLKCKPNRIKTPVQLYLCYFQNAQINAVPTEKKTEKTKKKSKKQNPSKSSRVVVDFRHFDTESLKCK